MSLHGHQQAPGSQAWTTRPAVAASQGKVCPQTSQRPPEGMSHRREACGLRAGALSSAGASPKSYSSLASLTLTLTFTLNVHGDTSVGTEGEAP